jgi:hypothetical protein
MRTLKTILIDFHQIEAQASLSGQVVPEWRRKETKMSTTTLMKSSKVDRVEIDPATHRAAKLHLKPGFAFNGKRSFKLNSVKEGHDIVKGAVQTSRKTLGIASKPKPTKPAPSKTKH